MLGASENVELRVPGIVGRIELELELELGLGFGLGIRCCFCFPPSLKWRSRSSEANPGITGLSFATLRFSGVLGRVGDCIPCRIDVMDEEEETRVRDSSLLDGERRKEGRFIFSFSFSLRGVDSASKRRLSLLASTSGNDVLDDTRGRE